MAVLKTENLTRHFGGLAALNGVSIEFRENEILGIIGPNGAGKTTFINVIAGIYLPTDGEDFFQRSGYQRTAGPQEMPAGHRKDLPAGEAPSGPQSAGKCHGGISLRERVWGKEKPGRKPKNMCEFLGLSDFTRDITRMTALEIKKMEIAHALATQPEASLSWMR